MKIAIWSLIGFNIAYLIVFEVISIFQCTPIPGGKHITYWPINPWDSNTNFMYTAWLKWDGTYTATCRDINLQGWVCCILLPVRVQFLREAGLTFYVVYRWLQG